MKLSVVIVNYNVRYFLEQCLLSVQKAMQGIEGEVFVVDNNSVDHSVAMVREDFPWVTLIENKTNTGFSKANNQAIKLAKGDYILLLNPDTIVQDDTFIKVCDFMDEHPEAGGLGVKMLDGKGRFLPESKRGLPTPAVAFYKISGLSRLFPKSKKFGYYHLGYLDKDQTHEVEILSGAFMLLRKKALDKTGLLDETFFMYGEDIDLSYRIIKAGYKNYYYPGTRIIHYKGESTKKGSINYVKTFYNAMVIFAEKHFSKKNARVFSSLINIAIYLRALLAILYRFFKGLLLPLTDAAVIYSGLYAITRYWESHIIYEGGGHYPDEFVTIVIPLYILIWGFAVFISGGYDKPVRLLRILRGFLGGTIIILIIYALLSETYRFSRALILIGTAWGIFSMLAVRFFLHLMKIKSYRLGQDKKKRFVIIGEENEAMRVAELLRSTYINPGFIGLASISNKIPDKEGFIGNFMQLKEIVNIYSIDEVIFCAKDVSAQKIIDIMTDYERSGLDFKIAPPQSLSIIGSNSISTSSDPFIIDTNSIGRVENRRNKRLFDIFISLIMLPASPILMIFVRKPFGFIRNLFLVLFAIRSWTGYFDLKTKSRETDKLPPLKKGVLNPLDAFRNIKVSPGSIRRLNLLYARDYKIMNELNILYNGFRELGRKS